MIIRESVQNVRVHTGMFQRENQGDNKIIRFS